MSRAPVDATHDPLLRSWVDSANGHDDFPIQNLPLGCFRTRGQPAAIGTAIGDYVLDLGAAARQGLFAQPLAAALAQPQLNALFALPAEHRRALRATLSAWLSEATHRRRVEPLLHHAAECDLLLPAAIGDYTDFYVGIHHATNVGRLFRPDNPLMANYKHVPIGYHGRASSVRASGHAIPRPHGQRKKPDADEPVFGPCLRMDYELELGVWIGSGNALGEPIAIADAPDHVAGLCLLNDWSARDIQAWEYQPLGPFLAKNFATTVSPWVVTRDALAPFMVAQAARPEGDPRPLPYLWHDQDQAHGAFAIELQAWLTTERMRAAGRPPHALSKGSATSMYWTVAQMIAHHTVNGCNLQAGDLLGTGTLSSATPEGYGSLLELSRGGQQPVELGDGEQRRFLEDGDEVIFRAFARAEGFVPIGFGECRGKVVPAHG